MDIEKFEKLKSLARDFDEYLISIIRKIKDKIGSTHDTTMQHCSFLSLKETKIFCIHCPFEVNIHYDNENIISINISDKIDFCSGTNKTIFI